MPQPESHITIKRRIVTPYLGLSEKVKETVVFFEYDLSRCIGSLPYRTGLDMIALKRDLDCCLATLYSNDSVVSLQVCAPEQVVLPATEKSENSVYGVWLT